ncbi:unnamed protein product [Closterium sp. Yama58-4]|nr:unnamed protein product [Closterium sp. Yama58-4]
MACTSGMSLRAMEKSLIASNGFLRSSGTVSHRLVTSAPLPRQRVSRLVTEAKVREIFMPALSSTMTEGKIVAWSKSEGESVSKGESVVVVESDKADMDVETFYDGIIATILVGEGEVAPVGAAIAILAESEEDLEAAKKKAAKLGSSDGAAAAAPAAAPAAPAPVAAAAPPPPPPAPAAPATPGKVVATPEAKKLAKKHKIDLAKVAGSGPYGRITPDDIKKAAGIATAPAPTIAAPAPAAAAPAPAARAVAASAAAAAPLPAGASVVAFTAMQGAVARNMEATLVVPTFRVGYTVTTDALDALYKRVKGKGVTMTALLAKASVNVAVAVAMDGGLITPVLKNADQTDLFTMSGQWKELVGKARRKALSPGDYSGGTFTLSNLGMFGVDRFDAILPIGQGAIMAVGSSIPTMVAEEDGSFGIKRQMQVNVTADHRIIYGADLAEFLQTFAKIVENPDQLTFLTTSPLRTAAQKATLLRFALHYLFELSLKVQMAPAISHKLLATSQRLAESTGRSPIGCRREQCRIRRPARSHFSAAPARMAFDCHVSLSELSSLGGLNPEKLNLPQKLAAKWGWWKEGAKAVQTYTLVESCWERRSADDIWFVILALVNAYIVDVPALRNLRAADSSSLQCMVGNCGPIILECFLDEQCRTAINCLNECGPTDQVCSYRCIVSYETPKFEAFSLCVLQKHNCLGMTAEIRDHPTVLPLTHLRGQPVTHERAEDIFVGWLGQLPWSWRVVAGQNAAYDQFPCQFQIFYRGKARGSVWYDPVFTIRTLDGRSQWRRRHYRVRRGKVPGTFTFTVLDNGVISEEFWRIVDVTDDFQWALFYYSGAARAAGQSYTGAVLVSKDGEWPGPEHAVRLKAALDRCGIKEWELYRVDNSCCENAPLGLPEDAPAPVSIA